MVRFLLGTHLLALQFVEGSDGAHLFNLGNGQGFTMLK